MLVNPASGRAAAAGRAESLAERLRGEGARVDVRLTAGPGDARRWTAEHGGGADLLACVGGDGTLNEVVRGLLDADLMVPVLPVAMGTANVVAHELGLPESTEALAALALGGCTRAVDLGLAERPGAPPEPFIMCLGAGFDAEVVNAVHRARGPRGMTQRAYARPLLAALARRHRPPVRLSADGTLLSESASLVIAANLSRYGGNRRVCADARCDDGLLDLCWVEGGPVALAAFVVGWLGGRLRPGGAIRFARASHIEFSSAGKVPVQMDGDPAGELPLVVSVLPAAVRFVSA